MEGFLVEPGDVAALADRIGQLVDDEELARRMGLAGRRRVERMFSSQGMLLHLDRLYGEMGFIPRQPAIPVPDEVV